ncbi:MAG: oligopeptidase A [Gammaproteobacteria bacterium]|jgi:oligopeptidase A|nr:oligopeptidase A [Gammaproteobacteria bacterium]MBT4145284.1 oligopeptidase A [Gammaproteobacteria bacterium]MBT5222255.1 oligopeptidase A [Gammaproteobacteria bacterium]MBT5826732.1 oligopeptidase A [Gammaproteobacteria bacterium]MBT6420097.1 oligopeptidase A [Gammaproteobacteria bacterium]
MNNPLLENSELPQFSQIKPEHIEPAIEQLLGDAQSSVEQLLAEHDSYSWENLIAPLDEVEDRINKAWSPVSHMNSVVNNDLLRDAYNACLPKLSAYSTEMGQHKGLFKAYQAIAASDDYALLDTAQKKIIQNALRSFRLSGVDLDAEKKARYKEISLELSRLASKYEENLLDATNAWQKLINKKSDLAGLPESALQQARQTAKQEGKKGWMLTLQFPSYIAVMTYADDRQLRADMYKAFSTRASELGSNSDWDNTEIMEQTIALRHEKAQLLGFNNYAELSLATKMADSTSEVTDFLEELAEKSLPQARKDLAELAEFVQQQYAVTNLHTWDAGYYSEKMRQYAYDLSQEEVKQYFPAPKVLQGLFNVVEKLYGLNISELDNIDAWHKDVRFFQIKDKAGELRGKFYIDLYARPHKRGGAWMDDCVGRKKTGDVIQIPVAYLTCNFTPPAGNDPALLSHDEVLTLFHEFGHGLQHMLTQVDYLGVSGINGVEWDAVELPSQFMENWCWEKESLALISGHYKTGAALPEELFNKMLAAKNFQAGMIMVRQLEFSLFDFKMHQDYSPELGAKIYDKLNAIREQVSVMIPPDFNRFAHSFAHIFSGGYAAGYYSYKWAEVLSSDAYSLFEENGIFDQQTGENFLTHILETGGSSDAMELFVKFRGREPKIDALLRHSGIAA